MVPAQALDLVLAGRDAFLREFVSDEPVPEGRIIGRDVQGGVDQMSVTGEKLSHLSQTIGWLITVEDWALIWRLHLAEGESMRSIAARLGISRNTVAKAVGAFGVASARPPR